MRFRKAGVLATFALSFILMSGLAVAATLSKVTISEEGNPSPIWSTDEVTDPNAAILSTTPLVPSNLDAAAGLQIFSFAGAGVQSDVTDFSITLYFTDSIGRVVDASLQNANGSMVPPEGEQVDLPEDQVSVKVVNFVINSYPKPAEEPDTAQTEGQFILQVSELLTAIDAQIDIKPGSDPNSINLKSRGVIPVALFGSEEFDVRDVAPSTVKLSGAGFRKFSFADVNSDGLEDMMLHFLTQQITDLDSNSTEATLTGWTVDGVEFSGTDSVNIVPKGKANGHEKEKKK